jgi:hypothetical protein
MCNGSVSYIADISLQWFDPYRGERGIVLDDFDGSATYFDSWTDILYEWQLKVDLLIALPDIFGLHPIDDLTNSMEMNSNLMH